MSKIKYKNYIIFGIWTLFAVFLFLFYANIYPLVIFDSDDWGNAGFMRTALPSLLFLNPAKILPETVAPLASKIGQYVFLPLTGNFIRSMTLAYSLMFTFFILLYCLMFDLALRNLFGLDKSRSLLLTAFFVLFHFSIFRVTPAQNQFLFGTVNLTCVWHYLIPNIFASAMVLWHICRKNNALLTSPLQLGIVLFACYLAIFSNLFSGIILASYAAVSLLVNLVKNFRKPSNRTDRCRIINDIVILCFWIISLLFEYNGDRAQYFSEFNLQASVGNFVNWIFRINKITLLALLLFVFMGILTLMRDKTEKYQLLEPAAECLLCLVITAVFLVLLSARTGGAYIARCDVIFGVFFYLFLIVLFFAAYAIKHFPQILNIVPLVFFVILSNTLVGTRLYRDINVLNLHPQSAAAVSNDLVDQVIAADRALLTDVTVYVPMYNSDDNWPQAIYMGHNFGATLYRHGITSKMMNITIEPSEEKNIEFNIPR